MAEFVGNLLGFPIYRDRLWRHEMPKPLADLYVAAQIAPPERQLEAVLHLGEAAVHFAATLALADAAACGTAPVLFRNWVKKLLPLSLGKTVHILQEAILASQSPLCAELRQWLDLETTKATLASLVKTRNRNAHHGGPVGILAKQEAARELAKDLLPLWGGLEFLQSYGFGYLVSAHQARQGGWEGHWHGWRGKDRSDDDGRVRGGADRVPRPQEVLLVSPDGQRCLSLSPLWAVVPSGGQDCLGVLVDLQGDGNLAELVYSEPLNMATKIVRKLDSDPALGIDRYYREPGLWHAKSLLGLAEDSWALIRGKTHLGTGGGRLQVLSERKTPFGIAWRATDTIDDGERLAFLATSHGEPSAAARKLLSERMRRVSEPALPRFLSMEPIDDRFYLVFESVTGQAVPEWLNSRSRLQAREAATLTRGILKALAEAHAAGLVHRAVEMRWLVRAADGRLRLTLPALPSEADANVTTRHSVLLLNRNDVPTLPTPEQFDVAGAAHILAELCGVGFELGKRPPDLQFEAASLSPPLAAWFDKASRRGDASPFTDARDALLALEQAIGHEPGWTTAAQQVGGGHRPVAVSEAATAVSAPVVVQLAPARSRQVTEGDRSLADAAGSAVPPATRPASGPYEPKRAEPALGWGLIAAVLATAGFALFAWWWATSQRETGSAMQEPSGPITLAAPLAPPAPAAETVPRAWDAIARVLPNGNAADEWRHQRGAPGIRDLFGSARQSDVEGGEASDVRSGVQICTFSTRILREKHSVKAEFSDGKLRRLGNPNLPTAAGRKVQAELPAADNSQTWSLGCGGSVEWRQVDGAWLHLYAPPGDGAWEWWLYPDLPAERGVERQILEAYSCNDAGVQAWQESRPDEALRLLRTATTLTPNYGWAAARGCKVAAYLGVGGSDLCAIAGQSNFKGAKGCASAPEGQEPPPAKLCGH